MPNAKMVHKFYIYMLAIIIYLLSVQEKTRGNERKKKNKQKTGVSFKYLTLNVSIKPKVWVCIYHKALL